MNGSVDVMIRFRRFGCGAGALAASTPAAAAAGAAAAGGAGRRGGGAIQYFSRLFTSEGYCSRVAVISVFRASISAFHLATRASEPTTVDASPVKRLAE